MKIKQNWDETRLQDYLLYGSWEPYFAFCVLSGLDGNYAKNKELSALALLDITALLFSDEEEKLKVSLRFQMADSINRLRDFWHSDGYDNDWFSPSFFIEWALSKRFEPDWLDWAIEKGLVKNINKELLVGTKRNQKELFDKSSPTYPPELDWAMRAWEAVKDDNGKGKPKAKVISWLNANSDLSSEAKKRISVVVNWDKTGGATRTD